MQNQLLTIGLAQPHRLFHHPTSTTPSAPLSSLVHHPFAIPEIKKITNSERAPNRIPPLFRPSFHSSLKSLPCGYSWQACAFPRKLCAPCRLTYPQRPGSLPSPSSAR